MEQGTEGERRSRSWYVVVPLFLSFFLKKEEEKNTSRISHFATDVLQVVYGNTKWAIDFTQYLMDDLFALAKELEPFLDDSEALTQKRESVDRLLFNYKC